MWPKIFSLYIMSLDVFLETEIISDVCFEDNEDVDQGVNIFLHFFRIRVHAAEYCIEKGDE